MSLKLVSLSLLSLSLSAISLQGGGGEEEIDSDGEIEPPYHDASNFLQNVQITVSSLLPQLANFFKNPTIYFIHTSYFLRIIDEIEGYIPAPIQINVLENEADTLLVRFLRQVQEANRSLNDTGTALDSIEELLSYYNIILKRIFERGVDVNSQYIIHEGHLHLYNASSIEQAQPNRIIMILAKMIKSKTLTSKQAFNFIAQIIHHNRQFLEGFFEDAANRLLSAPKNVKNILFNSIVHFIMELSEVLSQLEENLNRAEFNSSILNEVNSRIYFATHPETRNISNFTSSTSNRVLENPVISSSGTSSSTCILQ